MTFQQLVSGSPGWRSGVSVWRQIADTLATEIRDRAYLSMGRLPGAPIGLATAYYPAPRFAGLADMLLQGTCTTEILRHFGVQDYLRAQSRVTTQMPSEATARLLKQPVSRPLLCVECLDVDMEGAPIKYGETVFCGDRVQLLVTGREDA